MRWIIRIICFVLVLAVIAVAGVFLLPKDRLAAVAASQLSKVLGREVQLTGAVTPSFYPTLGVQVEGLTVAAPNWADNPEFVSADGVSIAVDVPALLGGDIQVSDLVINAPVVRLIRNADGQTTWDFGSAKDAQASADTTDAEPGRTVALDALRLSDATIIYQDAISGANYQVTKTDVDLSLPQSGTLTVGAKGVVQGQGFAVDATIAQLFDLLDGAPQSVDLNASVGNATVEFEGIAGTDGTAKGQLNADVTDLNAILQAAGQPTTSLPAGVRERLAVNASIDASPSQINLSGGTFRVGPNTLSGALNVALAGKPAITGSLRTNALDLRPFVGGGGGGAGGAEPASGQGWSKETIDASGLSAVNADLSLSAGSVDLGDTQLGQTDVRATLDNSRLVLELNNVQGFGGAVTGQFVVNNRNGLSMGGDLNAQNISLQTLLNGLLGFEKLDGPGGANVKFLASGSSLDALMNSLSGQASFNVGAGELRGVDLARLFGRQTEDGGGTTIFDSIGVSFGIQNGQLNTSDLSVLAPVFEALGEGKIGLGDQTIDFLVQPEVFRGDGDGIKVPVRIRGPWSNLKIFPDLEFLAKQELAIKEQELKAAAEAKLEAEKRRTEERLKQQAAEALNLEVEDGQSLEDAARSKVEDEIRRGLGNLLGGN